MKAMMTLLGCATLVLLAPLVTASDEMTLSGQFVWEHDDGPRDGPLAAVFTKTGDATWDVEFEFTWEDEAHSYKGTATGSREGDFSGEVLNDDKDHEARFQFELKFENGSYSGTHAYIGEEGPEDSGTLTLSE